MSSTRNRAAMRRFYDAINDHDLDALGACLAADNVAYCIRKESGQSRADYLERMQMVFEAFPDLEVEVLEVIAADDRVAARLRTSGTHEGEFMGIPASGRAFTQEGGDFCRFDDHARIVEHRAYADDLELLQQLGVVTADLAG